MTFNDKNRWVFPLVPTACAYAKLGGYFRKMQKGKLKYCEVARQAEDPMGETTLRRIPERPIEPRPFPPMAPRIAKTASKESEGGKKAENGQNQGYIQTMPGGNLADASVNSQVQGGQTQENAIWLREGSRIMGFGYYPEFTYREARSWIFAGSITVNDLLQGSNIMSANVVNFLNWMHKMQQVV